MPVTSGMKGEGFYDRHSSPQWACIEAVLPWLKTAISRLDLADSGAPDVLIDYACSEGAIDRDGRADHPGTACESVAADPILSQRPADELQVAVF